MNVSIFARRAVSPDAAHHRVAAPRRSLARHAALALATVALTGLAQAAPGGGPPGPEQNTLQDGFWDDPAVWELGLVPTDWMDGSIAYIRHNVRVDADGAVSFAFVGVGGQFGSITQEGGDLECFQMVVGRSASAYVEQAAGTSTAVSVIVGNAHDATYFLDGGSLVTESLSLGGIPGQPGPGDGNVFIEGGSLTVTQDLLVHAGSKLRFGPVSDGETIVQAGSVEFMTGSEIEFFPGYEAQTGDAWDVVVSSTPIVGLPDLEQPAPFLELAYDLSDPNVLRVVVIDSVWPVWTDLGGGSPGVNGVPTLTGLEVPLVEGAPAQLDLGAAPASGFVLFIGSLTSTPLPALGGTVHAYPWTIQILAVTDGAGGLSVGTTWPGGVPAGTDFYVQVICEDGTVPDGLTLSNALVATTP